MRRKVGERADRRQWSPDDDSSRHTSERHGSRHNGGYERSGVLEFHGTEEECRRARMYLERMRVEEGVRGDLTISSRYPPETRSAPRKGGDGPYNDAQRERRQHSHKNEANELDDTPIKTKRERMRFDDADTAFILGRGGKTKQKISRVSGAQLELYERSNAVDIVGAEEECRRARKYIDLVRMQRVGPVHFDASHDDGDLTLIDVPSNCVGFVTGSKGVFLRACEEEWGTLMFFCDYQGPDSVGVGIERLAIFGSISSRAGAELKVMAAIETKKPGHFTSDLSDIASPEEWGRDTIQLANEELSFALGKDGSTRKKLARASGCIVEYIGNFAFMVGQKAARARARDYITWLIGQRTGHVHVDIDSRTDASAIEVPTSLTGIFTSSALRDIEHETDTFCFLEGDAETSNRLLIFGGHRSRKQACKKARELISLRPRQTAGDDTCEHYRSDQLKTMDVRISVSLADVIDAKKLTAIQKSCGAKLVQHETESISIQGNDQQVFLGKRQLHEYIYSLKVEEDFSIPPETPLRVFIAKGIGGQISKLEEVRNQTRVRVKVVAEENKIVLAGLFSIVANARRELQTFSNSFMTQVCRLEKDQLAEVSAMGKTEFCKMQHFRHLCAAHVNKELLTLTLSGTPEAVNEGRRLVNQLFERLGWTPPSLEPYKTPTRSTPKNEKSIPVVSAHGARKGAEMIQLTESDSAFILGRGGKTKQKIAKVSGAQLELHEPNNTVEVIGTDEERGRARKYIDLVRAQRVGPVNVDESQDDGDLTILAVPNNCVGFVTGSGGNFLRACEEEWSTLMFFSDYHGPNGDDSGSTEKLAIFGGRAGRAGAQLKVMAAIETKIPGHFTFGVADECSPQEWGQDTMPLGEDELSFALGKDGMTRKKLARASGCILEYIGSCAFMIGSLAARRRARDYLTWLMKQRTSSVYPDIAGRTDVSVVKIPIDLLDVGSIFKSSSLRSIEQDSRTFCFLEGSPNKSEKLYIFGHDAESREKIKAECLDRIRRSIRAQEEHSYERSGRHGDQLNSHRRGYESWENDVHYGNYDRSNDYHAKNVTQSFYDTPDKSHRHDKYNRYERYDSYEKRDKHSRVDKHFKNEKIDSNHAIEKKSDVQDVTDHFALRGDISVHVVIQTGPNGEDPLIEDVESKTGTQLQLLRDKGLIQIHGSVEKVKQAKWQLQAFADKFITCKIQMRPEITAALSNKVSHYIRPMAWIASADVDETKDLLKIQGHQDSVERTLEVLREVYLDHDLELNDADIVTKKRTDPARDEYVFANQAYNSRPNVKGKSADVMKVGEDDAAFILGRGGRTKHKIARVSGATLELHERTNTVEIFGTPEEQRKARKYVELVKAQRIGPVNVDESHDDGDLTMIAVPHNCVGFVTGSQGNFLRTCEEEWGTLMFFCDYQGPSGGEYGGAERLAIFGELRSRCGAELKVMAAIETKIPRYYTKNLGDTHCPDDWGFDTIPLQPDQLSYALGKKGSTRRKLARSSGCIVEYVGHIAFLSGTLDQRKRGREYLGWMCDQISCKTGRISIDPSIRDDVTLVPVPRDCIGYVMGDKRKTLSRLEEDWDTLIFFVDSRSLPSYQDVEGLAIFGSERGRAGTELKVMGAVETKIPVFFTKGVGDFHCPAEWGVDTVPFKTDELSFALGKNGNTRKKLARASGCILEYVGNIAYMAGAIEERTRARDYLLWLLRQRHGAVLIDVRKRNDVTVLEVPLEMMGMTKASLLRDVEKETGTFCFFQGDASTSSTLMVCGHRAEDRAHAERILYDILVRGASRPKPKRRANRPTKIELSRRTDPHRAMTGHRSSDDSASYGSETGSEGESDAPQAFDPRRQQWPPEQSNSASDEEIVPYW